MRSPVAPLLAAALVGALAGCGGPKRLLPARVELAPQRVIGVAVLRANAASAADFRSRWVRP